MAASIESVDLDAHAAKVAVIEDELRHVEVQLFALNERKYELKQQNAQLADEFHAAFRAVVAAQRKDAA